MLDLRKLGRIADLNVALLHFSQVLVFIVLLLVGGLFAVPVTVHSSLLLHLKVGLAVEIDCAIMLVGVYFDFVAGFEVGLVYLLGVPFDVLFIRLLGLNVLNPLLLSFLLDAFLVLVLLGLVLDSALLHLFCKLRFAVGNFDLCVKAILLSLELSQSIFHQKFLKTRSINVFYLSYLLLALFQHQFFLELSRRR